VATLTIPALVRMGVNEIAAHMFCFYFAILSGITPPVAIGAFVAAGIAKANELKTAVTAVKLGLVGLVVPYLFVYDNSFLLMGTVWETVPNFVLAIIGVYALSASLNGYLFAPLSLAARAVIFASAAALLWPRLWEVNLVGLVVFGACYAALNMARRRAIQAPAPGVR
jgi:TRAP-type uncharacterized transport system fused permease subunit